MKNKPALYLTVLVAIGSMLLGSATFAQMPSPPPHANNAAKKGAPKKAKIITPKAKPPVGKGKADEVLLAPLHLDGNISLVFNKNDMDVVVSFLEVYDDTTHSQKTEATPAEKDDLSSLLQSLKSHELKPAAAQPLPLPNLYLGSIVYYSPSHWSVWINGKKLLNTNNEPTNPLYVSRLSREEVELVWKPGPLLSVPGLWKQLTDNGKQPLPRIHVDEAHATITLIMRTNETFLPKLLAIHEGFVKAAPIVLPPSPTATPTTAPSTASIPVKRGMALSPQRKR